MTRVGKEQDALLQKVSVFKNSLRFLNAIGNSLFIVILFFIAGFFINEVFVDKEYQLLIFTWLILGVAVCSALLMVVMVLSSLSRRKRGVLAIDNGLILFADHNEQRILSVDDGIVLKVNKEYFDKYSEKVECVYTWGGELSLSSRQKVYSVDNMTRDMIQKIIEQRNCKVLFERGF